VKGNAAALAQSGSGRSGGGGRGWCGEVKGKCALGPFLSILVIKCPTQVPKC
jgi:hypothetical protein